MKAAFGRLVVAATLAAVLTPGLPASAAVVSLPASGVQVNADPANGIDRILTHEDLVSARAFPDAAYLVAFKPGFEFGSSLSPPLVAAPSNRGTHGYLPDRPEMRSSFFLIGPRIARGRSLGEIDMRQIAPTLAAVLHLSLPQAELGPLSVE